ncbi:MAG TPA: altronate dehydratase family protein, partial [Pirellulales bacterium]
MSTTLAGPIDVVLLRPEDSVCIAARGLPAGAEISAGDATLTLVRDVAGGHKIAMRKIAKGEPIVRCGQIIGFATENVRAGEWVHVHNLAAGEFDRDYAFCSETPPDPSPIVGRTFMGYRRPDGRAATRNYVAVISNVNCSANVSKLVAARFDKSLLAAYPNIDGVIAVTHKAGCAMQYNGEDHHQLNRVLGGYAKHANIGAYLMIGLGCETGALGHLQQDQNLYQIRGAQVAPGAPKILVMQDLGGTAKTVEAAVKALAELLPAANDVKRVPIPASEIILGTNCGGSDGNSGVTANPALGVAGDMLVAAGGTSVLAETPEIYGAEHVLTRRAKTREVGEKLVARIKWWEDYTRKFGVVIDNNPSPGNKAGGLTTIYEKSLGAVAKGGTSALSDVFLYAEPITTKGFVIMDTPGYDPASVTGLVAGGCNVIAFTTGRGSCFACKPSPSIKIATNTPMYERMVDDMDVD